MAAHKGPASLRPRCTRSGSSVAAIPIYHPSLQGLLVPAVTVLGRACYMSRSLYRAVISEILGKQKL
jgi:hypothetical protein